jgi:hypothetical protein
MIETNPVLNPAILFPGLNRPEHGERTTMKIPSTIVSEWTDESRENRTERCLRYLYGEGVITENDFRRGLGQLEEERNRKMAAWPEGSGPEVVVEGNIFE